MSQSLDYHRRIAGARQMVLHTKLLRELSDTLLAESKTTIALSHAMEDSRKAVARAKDLEKYLGLVRTNHGEHMTDHAFRTLVQCLDRASALYWETEALHARVVATVERTRRCIAEGIALRANARELRDNGRA